MQVRGKQEEGKGIKRLIGGGSSLSKRQLSTEEGGADAPGGGKHLEKRKNHIATVTHIYPQVFCF